METQQYLDQLAQNSERARRRRGGRGHRRRRCPSCPEWTVADLARSTASRGDAWARTIVEQGKAGSTERVLPGDDDESLQGDALVDCVPRRRAGARRHARVGRRPTPGVDVLVDRPHRVVLAAAPGAGDRGPPLRRRARRGHADTARRRARGRRHRRVPHRVPAPPGRQLRPRWATAPSTCTAPTSTASGCSRTARRRGRGHPEHAKGDVAARGHRVRLLLFLWGRVPADALEVFGDADAARAVPRRRSGSSRARSAPGRGSCRAPSRRAAMIDGAVVVTPLRGVVARRVRGSARASPTR